MGTISDSGSTVELDQSSWVVPFHCSRLAFLVELAKAFFHASVVPDVIGVKGGENDFQVVDRSESSTPMPGDVGNVAVLMWSVRFLDDVAGVDVGRLSSFASHPKSIA